MTKTAHERIKLKKQIKANNQNQQGLKDVELPLCEQAHLEPAQFTEFAGLTSMFLRAKMANKKSMWDKPLRK